MPRPRMHLTDAAVKRLPIPTLPANVPKKAMGSAMRDYFDRDVTGFHVRCSPSGRKTFALAYAMRDTGTRRRFIIGDYPALTADDARTLARQRLNEVASGIDPQAVRDQKRVTAAHTVTQLADAFLAVRQIKDSTRALYGSLFRLHILPKLGACAVADVTTDDIARMHAKLHAHKTTADQCVRLLATLFRYAEKTGARLKGTNPATDVERYGEHLKERYLQPHELAALIRALDTAETSGLPAAPERQRKVNPTTARHAPPPTPGKQNVARGTVLRANPTAVAALRLLLVTGSRKSEVLGLQWKDIDRESKVMILGETKTGRSVRPLSPIALEILDSVRRVVGSPYVFTSPTNARKPLGDPSRLWDAVRVAADLEDIRLHDLRHTAASMMLQAGATLAEVGRAIGHKSTRATQRYAAMNDAGAQRAANLLSTAVTAARAVPETPVTRLPAKAVREPQKRHRLAC